MPEDKGLSAGKRSAATKGPEGLKTAAREAVSTKNIREAQRRLDAIAVELEAVQKLLGKVESKVKRGKRTA
jgi:hypothetical protein